MIDKNLQEDLLNFRDLIFELIIRNWWLFLLFMVFGFYVAKTYMQVSPRTYETSALLQFINKGGARLGAVRLSGSNQEAAKVIMRSRSVAGEVVKNLKLDIAISPVLFPVIGKYFYSYHLNKGSDLVPLGFWQSSKYAWGGEKLKLDIFEVPEEFINKAFTLSVIDNNQISLSYGGKEIDKFAVGKIVGNSGFKIRVKELKARPGNRFIIKKLSLTRSVKAVINNLKVYQEGGRNSGIARIKFEYGNQDLMVSILNNLVVELIKKMENQKTGKIEEDIQIIENQLPIIEERVQRAESEYREFLTSSDFAAEGTEVPLVVNKLSKLEENLTETKNKKRELERVYTEKHPVVTGLDIQIQKYEKELKELKKSAQELPELQLKQYQLKREIETARKLRSDLTDQLQSYKVLKGAQTRDIDVVDYAINPESFIAPSNKKVVAISLLGALMIAFALAYLRYLKSSVLVEEPKDLASVTETPVWADVPYSVEQKTLLKTGKIISEVDVYGGVAESMRSLRAVINLHLLQANNRFVSVTSPMPKSGKSFVSMNLGYLMAKQHKKVLLIDADMRKGHTTTEMLFSGKKGLREYLESTEEQIENIIHETKFDNLFIIPSGSRSNISSDILTSNKFKELIQNVGENFDVVIFDTPPLLVLTDASTIGREVGCNIMVLPQGQVNKMEVKTALKRAELSGVTFDGIILNKNSVSVVSKYYHKYLPYKYSYYKYRGYGYTYGGYKQKYYKYDQAYGYDAEEPTERKKAS